MPCKFDQFAGGNAWIPEVLRQEYPNLGLDAEFLATEMPGVHVPHEIVERMRRAQDSGPEAAVEELAGQGRDPGCECGLAGREPAAVGDVAPSHEWCIGWGICGEGGYSRCIHGLILIIYHNRDGNVLIAMGP